MSKEFGDQLASKLRNYALGRSNLPLREIIQPILTQAELGDAESQFMVGRIYDCLSDGFVVEPEALGWYYRAAKGGFAGAQYRLWMIFDDGDGVVVNSIEALKWLRRAAEQGHILAQFSLAELYCDEEDSHFDLAESIKWFTAAAERGHIPSQFILGNSYYNGRGVPQDLDKAVEWFRRCFSKSPWKFSGKKKKEDDVDTIRARARDFSLSYILACKDSNEADDFIRQDYKRLITALDSLSPRNLFFNDDDDDEDDDDDDDDDFESSEEFNLGSTNHEGGETGHGGFELERAFRDSLPVGPTKPDSSVVKPGPGPPKKVAKSKAKSKRAKKVKAKKRRGF
ncbi:MAG: sel1 repeat family protein [Deltaproteobacteria bacterium]|jgi:hypothetical protein|nr:sel1 repeat family protein [Deltaproteobacteria bacterium]